MQFKSVYVLVNKEGKHLSKGTQEALTVLIFSVSLARHSSLFSTFTYVSDFQ